MCRLRNFACSAKALVYSLSENRVLIRKLFMEKLGIIDGKWSSVSLWHVDMKYLRKYFFWTVGNHLPVISIFQRWMRGFWSELRTNNLKGFPKNLHMTWRLWGKISEFLEKTSYAIQIDRSRRFSSPVSFNCNLNFNASLPNNLASFLNNECALDFA